MSAVSATVAVLSWNGRGHLETCLEALADQEDGELDWEVAVLDNGSGDGTWEWLEREWQGRRVGRGARGTVRAVRSEQNLGFCAGNQRLITTSRSDVIVLLNNDTRPEPDWLAVLVASLCAAPEDVAAVSGLIVDWEGRALDFAEGVMTFDGHAFQRDFHRPLDQVRLPEDGAELLFPCGGNMAIRRRSYLDLGGFDPSYFAYLEDVDLGWRLWASGQRVELAREARVHHRSMASSEMLGIWKRGFLFERNAFLTAFKNYDRELFGKLMPAVLMTLLSRTETLLATGNAGGDLLRVDPYGAAQDSPVNCQPSWLEKWRGWGTRELARRGWRRARRELADWIRPGSAEAGPTLSDPRTVAQLQAVSWIVANLGHAETTRRRAQELRVRSDREIFERFPLLLVPTYPGDEELFSRSGFTELLPDDIAIVRSSLGELMCLE